jgi:hypothetical protein
MTENMNDDFGLSQFDEEYASAEVEERDFEDIPDGKFQVQVDRVEMTHAKTSGNPMLKWSLKILGPTHQGRFLWRNNMLVSAENIKWLKGDLLACGLELEKLSELPANLEKLLDVKLEITKRTYGDNESVYFNRRIVTDDIPDSNDEIADDIPF